MEAVIIVCHIIFSCHTHNTANGAFNNVQTGKNAINSYGYGHGGYYAQAQGRYCRLTVIGITMLIPHLSTDSVPFVDTQFKRNLHIV